MAWVLRSPQIHSSFSNLGYAHSDGYHVNVNCNDTLEVILQNLLNEDPFQRSYRRSISFGQSIQKDLIPLLIHAQDDKTVELLIKILTNLTIPVECLLSIGTIVETDIGRHIVFEINSLLASTKSAITDHRVTKVIIEFLKKNVEYEQNKKLSADHRDNICNTLLLLRNILHIPEESSCRISNHTGPPHMLQNKILANLFTQNIDKVLLKLIAIPDAIHWAVTMVQLVALLYKDQHIMKLYKLLNVWLETKSSESSEDNESNTSPQNGEGSDQSPIMSSDPEIGGNGKSDEDGIPSTDTQTNENELQSQTEAESKCESEGETENDKNVEEASENNGSPVECAPKENIETETSYSENTGSLETQEAATTSSNEDEVPAKAMKSHNTANTQDRKRKKIVKRVRLNINNFKGLTHNLPTDDVISNALKEFTVDFLLKGYNSLVQTLHIQIITNIHLDIDTSHFFWLITYFLKFVTQIELDLEHVSNVLSFDIISYLTAESANLCEQFQLLIKLDGNDLVSCRRRLHLAVTAIREFVQAIDIYLKSTNVNQDDKEVLLKLQLQMCETDQLRSLLVLLLRHYNPTYHSKQYLQDLIVTNHILLASFDDVMRMPEYKGTGTIFDHVSQFATPEMMYQFGLLLEDYRGNGEFVNDCVFTILHHVGVELGCLFTLFQPIILQTFTSIWKTEFEICDDWTNLIKFTINSFVKKPHKLQIIGNTDDKKKYKSNVGAFEDLDYVPMDTKNSSRANSKDGWAEHEISSLSWYYMQCKTKSNVIGEIVNLFKEDGIYKTSEAVVNELLNQSIITKQDFDKLEKNVADSDLKVVKETKKLRENEIGKLCEQLALNGKSKYIDWVQSVLLETCYAKICLQKQFPEAEDAPEGKSISATCTKDVPVVSPVSYHALLSHQSVPLVPWNSEQAAICKDLKFLQLVYKLGFYMPVDTGKMFIRIPHFWTPDFIYEVAGKIGPIEQSKLKFSLSDISQSSIQSSKKLNVTSTERSRTLPVETTSHTNHYQVHKEKHHTKLLNFTPTPGSSFASTGNSQPNWLEMIQKAQEYKIFLGKSLEKKANSQMIKVEKKKSCSAFRSRRRRSSASTRRCGDHGHTHHDFEGNSSSSSETSVASDLTRMYVSDEDDKFEVASCAERRVGMDAPDATSDVDDECVAIAAKRPRVHAMPPF